jgi:hypothetical protein
MLMKKQAGRNSTSDTEGMGSTEDAALRTYDQNRSSSPGMEQSSDTNLGGTSSYGQSPMPDQAGERSQDWNGRTNGF